MKEVGMSMRDMRNEIRLIEATFKNLSGKELREAQVQVGKLRNEMGDMRAMMRTVGEDAIPIMVNSIRGLTGVAQTVTGSLAAMGIETKGLDKAMMGLINISMGMSQVWEMYEKKTLQATVALIKNSIATKAKSIADKVMAATTNTATTAQKALNLALLAGPYVLVAAAIAGIVVAVVKMSDAVEEAEARWVAWSTAARENIKGLLEGSAEIRQRLVGINKEIQDFNDRNLSNAEKQIKYLAIEYDANDKKISQSLDLMKVELSRLSIQRMTQEANIDWLKLSPELYNIALKGVDDMKKKEAELTKQLVDGYVKQKESRVQAIENLAKINESLTAIEETTKKEGKSSSKVTEKKKAELTEFDIFYKKLDEDWKQMVAELPDESLMFLPGVPNSSMMADTIAINQQLSDEYNKTEAQKLKDSRDSLLISEEEYQAGLKEIEEKALAERVKRIENFTKKAAEMMQMGSQILTNLDQIDANNFATIRKDETDQLDAEYKRRLQAAGNNAYQKKMVEEWYTTEAAKLNEDLAAKQEEIDRKNKIRNQVIAVGQATMDYAQGLVKIWAENASKVITIPVAVALSGLLTGVYATQLGVIKSQKFKDGGTDVLSGNPHEGGGIRFAPNKEAEGGERWAIFNKEATLRNTGLANLIDDINLHNLVIDKNFMSKIHGDSQNIVMVNNFKGGEHIKAIREYLENSKTGDKYLPDGRIQKGIIKRRYN
jgi:hypothetical protein